MPIKYKYIMVGNSGVGKTCLLKCLLDINFDRNTQATIGPDIFKYKMKIDGTAITLELWDTAGMERFKSISSSNYRNVSCAILVYDVTERSSFQNLTNWLREINDHCDSDIVIALIGNKSDLHSERKVTYEEGAKFAMQHGFIFREASALNGDHVEQLFIKTANKIYESKPQQKPAAGDANPEFNANINLEREYNGKEKVNFSCAGLCVL